VRWNYLRLAAFLSRAAPSLARRFAVRLSPATLAAFFARAVRSSGVIYIADCAFGKDGLTVTLRRSKTDQDGAGRKIGIPYGSNPDTCPVRTVQTWIETAALSGGALFRSINRHGQVQAGKLSGIELRAW
jgi:hypothetical protein